jgi:hypothetical protein
VDRRYLLESPIPTVLALFAIRPASFLLKIASVYFVVVDFHSVVIDAIVPPHRMDVHVIVLTPIQQNGMIRAVPLLL